MADSLAHVNGEAWRDLSKAGWGSRAARQRWFHDDLLYPAITELVSSTTGPILDFGCGDGALAAHLVSRTARVVYAYDPSPGMVEAASSVLEAGRVAGSLTEFDGAQYGAVVANMVLQTVEDLDGVLSELVACSPVGGSVFVSIPHPCFALIRELHRSTERSWVKSPTDREPPLEGSLAPLTYYFDRTVEAVSWAPGARSSTFIFNRTIEEYLDSFAMAGLKVQTIREPRPTISLEGGGHDEFVDLFSRVPAFLVFGLQRVAS